ncbi:hypothetical protein JQC92_01435 [Shewanella sp. 202IG2-18]|uniref:cold adaptation protein AtcC n=1 Tax=Parashewanella hymeniacidonis TaxID=2807618 RepID=UPI001961250E|nr:hypothetical protein [Parashewanella hymeniacidonis]MBM7070705.1 hypothetical protein [Parashewanella hymeniacidonis]
MQIVLRDPNQGPFLLKTLKFAAEEEILSETELADIKKKAILMSLKLADKFYNKYKMHLLEQAAQDVIGVASLGLMALANQDQVKAILLLKKPDGLVKSFQRGWTMLATVSKYKLINIKSVYGEVEQRLLETISCPADHDEWTGWDIYQDALKEHHKEQAAEAVKSLFFFNPVYDPIECLSIEEMFAEAIVYRVLCGGQAKVKKGLKKRLPEIEFESVWLKEDFIKELIERNLETLPEQLQETIRTDLNRHFASSIVKTIKFAQKYREEMIKDATPEKLERMEHKQGMIGLIGWPIDPFL